MFVSCSEDYMDAEDLADSHVAGKTLVARDGFRKQVLALMPDSLE